MWFMVEFEGEFEVQVIQIILLFVTVQQIGKSLTKNCSS